MAQSKSFVSKLIKRKKSLLKFRSNPITVGLAAMAGAALMIPVSTGVIASSVHSNLSGQLASLNNRLVQMQTADMNLGSTPNSCIAPASGNGTEVQTAQQLSSATTTPSLGGGKGAGPGAPGSTTNNTFVKKIVTGSLVAKATNENTGPGSTNTIDISNQNTSTVSNTNDVHLTTVNHQESESGDATVSGNTTGGSATSGDSTNTSNTDISILFKN